MGKSYQLVVIISKFVEDLPISKWLIGKKVADL
jgi:hypothetical protein